MGKASTGKKLRTRDQKTAWTPSAAAQRATLLHKHALIHLPGNPFIAQLVERNAVNGAAAIYRGAVAAGLLEEAARHYARTCILGGLGRTPPWTDDMFHDGPWLIDQHTRMLQAAELCVVSPAVHAAVMAAAASLTIADTGMLKRDEDIPFQTGLLVLPSPIILETPVGGGHSDIVAVGWEFADVYAPHLHGSQPGVRVTPFMDRDGPVQTRDWQTLKSVATQTGRQLPRLVPDGVEAMTGNGAYNHLTDDELRDLTDVYHERAVALRHNRQALAVGPRETGEWAGEAIADNSSDFIRRYMFAFWRLTAQRTITEAPPATVLPTPRRPQPDRADSGQIRVMQLANRTTAGAQDEPSGRTTAYHHRWAVRMHKVRQWYPSLGEHRIIWRGPYIKGPAGAPLLLGDKVYTVTRS